MSKLKKFSYGLATLGMTIFIGTNAYAASSTAVVNSSNSKASGHEINVKNNRVNLNALNQSSINFYAKVMTSNRLLPNTTHYSVTITDYEEFNKNGIYVKDKEAFPRAEWTGEAGLKYLQGSVSISN
ncbi:hypothetical protein G9298_28485 (plasmid) [Bacillus thuringiensis]|nr:hypothetical protein G9298_28485 [Bacillus thuringiensis]